MGSQNPKNLGYRYSTPHKRYKHTNADKEAEKKLPSNIVVQFKNRQGEQVANHLDLPTSSSVDDLSALVHTLLQSKTKTSAFRIHFMPKFSRMESSMMSK